MSLHGRFKDEADFRDKFIKPLLNRLGFFGVEEQHGRQEFGKDFVFSELHRLGGMRHYAAQVKYEKTINQGAKVDELLSQIRQAFAVAFRRGDSPRDCHVSAVYVFNSGEITDNARTFIASALTREHYGDNVHFLDGERLDALNQFATLRADEQARARLVALNNQLILNSHLWQLVQQEREGGPITGQRILVHGIESFLSEPLEATAVSYDLLYRIWARASNVETIRMKLMLPIGSEQVRRDEREVMQEEIKEILAEVAMLRNQIVMSLSKFQPII